MEWRFIVITLLIVISIPAESNLSYPEFKKRIADYQNRNKFLREQIAQEQAAIEDLKKRLGETERRIEEIRKKRLDALGISSEDVTKAYEEIEALRRDVLSLEGVSDELFIRDSSRVHYFGDRLHHLKSQPVSRQRKISVMLSATERLIDKCKRRLEELLASSVKTAVDKTADGPQETGNIESYTVINDDKHESLFSIAAKVYGDPLQWPRIYEANKEVIDRNFRRYSRNTKSSAYSTPADLIFPGQVLKIPK